MWLEPESGATTEKRLGQAGIYKSSTIRRYLPAASDEINPHHPIQFHVLKTTVSHLDVLICLPYFYASWHSPELDRTNGIVYLQEQMLFS